MFKRQSIFTEAEIKSRQEILLEGYNKIIHIEAMTMLDMAQRNYLPAIMAYSSQLAESASRKAQLGIENGVELKVCQDLSQLLTAIDARAAALFRAIDQDCESDSAKRACYYRDSVLPAMQALRAAVDDAEPKVGARYWPYPSYGELLFSVR